MHYKKLNHLDFNLSAPNIMNGCWDVTCHWCGMSFELQSYETIAYDLLQYRSICMFGCAWVNVPFWLALTKIHYHRLLVFYLIVANVTK